MKNDLWKGLFKSATKAAGVRGSADLEKHKLVDGQWVPTIGEEGGKPTPREGGAEPSGEAPSHQPPAPLFAGSSMSTGSPKGKWQVEERRLGLSERPMAAKKLQRAGYVKGGTTRSRDEYGVETNTFFEHASGATAVITSFVGSRMSNSAQVVVQHPKKV